MTYADIIVDISHEKLDKSFQYLVPEKLKEGPAQKGWDGADIFFQKRKKDRKFLLQIIWTFIARKI